LEVELTDKEQYYMEILEYLNQEYDENTVRKEILPNNLRCVSFTQSYNIRFNQDFYHLDEALTRARILCEDPFLEL